MWYSNDMFHYMLKAEFVTPVSLKVPSGYPTSKVLSFPQKYLSPKDIMPYTPPRTIIITVLGKLKKKMGKKVQQFSIEYLVLSFE